MAEARAVINVDINTAGAAAGIRRLQSQLNAFQSTLLSSNRVQAQGAKNLSLQLRELVNATQFFSAETVRMRTSAGKLDDTLSKGKGSVAQYFNSFKKGSTEASQVMSLAHSRAAALQTQFVATGAAAGGYREAMAIRPLTAFNSAAAVSAERLAIQRAMLTQATTHMINFGKNTQWAGRQLMVGFTVPLTIFGAVAGKTFMEIEKQAISFKKVYGDSFTTPKELEENLKAVQGLSEEYTKYGIAASKTMELAAQAAAMGAQGATLTDAITESTKLATLGQMEQTKALETTIALQNAFGLSGEKLAKSVNFLNMVENQTVVTLQDLAEAIPRVAPVIQGLGGSVEDMAAMIAAMKEGGISAAQGANALKSGLGSLINPSKRASEQLKSVGINMNQILSSNRGDLMGIVQDFGRALSTIDEFGQQQVLEKVFGKYQYARLGALFNNIVKDGTQASKVLEMTTLSAAELQRTADKELGVIADSPATKMTAAIEKLKLAIAPLGEMFVKFATPVVELFTKILKIFDGLPEGVKKFGAIGAIIVGVIIPAGTMFLGLLLNLIGTLVKFGHIMGVAFKGLLSGGIGGAVKAVSQSLRYMSLAEIDAANASKQLGESTIFVNAALNSQISELTGVNAAVVRLMESYRLLRTQMNLTAASNPMAFSKGEAAAVIAAGGTPAAPPRRVRRNAGGTIPYYSTGNTVPGSGNTDTVPAMLTPGEFVINKKATADNLSLLHAINNGNTPLGFNKGGSIPEVQNYGIGNFVRSIFKPKLKPSKPSSAYDTEPTEKETAMELSLWDQRPQNPGVSQFKKTAASSESEKIYQELISNSVLGQNVKVDTLRFAVERLGLAPAQLGLRGHGNFIVGLSQRSNLAMAGNPPSLTRNNLLSELTYGNPPIMKKSVYRPIEEQINKYFNDGQPFDYDAFDNIFRNQIALAKEPISNNLFEKISRNALRLYLEKNNKGGARSRSFIKDILTKDTVRANIPRSDIEKALMDKGIPYDINGKDIIATVDGVRYNFGSLAGREMGSLGRPAGIIPYANIAMAPGLQRAHANKGGMIPGVQYANLGKVILGLIRGTFTNPRKSYSAPKELQYIATGYQKLYLNKRKGVEAVLRRAIGSEEWNKLPEETKKQMLRAEVAHKFARPDEAVTLKTATGKKATKEFNAKRWDEKELFGASGAENKGFEYLMGSSRNTTRELFKIANAGKLSTDQDRRYLTKFLNGVHPTSKEEIEAFRRLYENFNSYVDSNNENKLVQKYLDSNTFNNYWPDALDAIFEARLQGKLGGTKKIEVARNPQKAKKETRVLQYRRLGGGVVNQDQPFYGKYDQLTKALYSKWVGAQSSEIAAIKTGVGSDPAMAMAYGKGFRRSKEAMDLERSLFIRNNDLPKIGDEIELGNLSSFAAGGKDTIKHLYNSNLQKNAEFKGNELLGLAQKGLWEAAKRRRRILAGKIISADRYYNMPFGKPGDVPGPGQGVQGLLDDLDRQIKIDRASVKEYKAVIRDYKDHVPVIYRMHTPSGTPMANIDDIVPAENQTLWSGAGKSMVQVSEGERILHKATASVIGISTRKLLNGREATVIELRLNPSSAQYPQFRADGGKIFESGPSNKIVPGVGNTDTVPAMLTPGEFVINKKATKDNLKLLHAINSGNVRGYEAGDIVERHPGNYFVENHRKQEFGPFGSEKEAKQILKNMGINKTNMIRLPPPSRPAGLGMGRGMGIGMGLGSVGMSMMMSPMIPGVGSNEGLSNALTIGGTALSAASIIPSLAPMLAPLAAIAAPAAIVVGALGAVGAGLYVWRKNVDESARASAELGANLGATSNALGTMAKLFGSQTPSQRSMQLQMGVSTKEAEILNSPEMQSVLSSEDGQKFITNLKDVTSAERFKKLSDYLKSAIASGMMDKTQASSFAKAVGMQLGDVALGTSVSSAIRNQRTGSGALLELANQRKSAQEQLGEAPGADQSSKIIGGALQVIQDFSNAEALAREEFSAGTISFEEMKKVIDASREAQEAYTDSIEESMKKTSDFGGTMQATKDQMIKSGLINEDQFNAITAAATSATIVPPTMFARGSNVPVLDKDLEATMLSSIAAGMNPENAIRIGEEIGKKSGIMFDAYQSAIDAGHGLSLAFEKAAVTDQLLGKDGIIKGNLGDRGMAKGLLDSFTNEGGKPTELVSYLGGISEKNRNNTVGYMTYLDQKEKQMMISDSQNLSQSIDQLLVEKLQMSDAYKKALNSTNTGGINKAVERAAEVGVKENIIEYAINTTANGKPADLEDKINKLTTATENISSLPEEMIKGLRIDITLPQDLEKFGPMVDSLKQNWPIIQNLDPNIDMTASMNFITMGNDGKLLTPEQISKNVITLNKAWAGLSSKNKNTRLEAIRQLIVSTQDAEGNTLDPAQVDAAYNDLIQQFGGKIMNLPPDVINKLISLQVEVEGIDAAIAATKLEMSMGGSDARLENLVQRLADLQAAKKARTQTQKTVVSSAPKTSAGGGGGGGGTKSIIEQLKEEFENLKKIYDSMGQFINSKKGKFKGIISGPFGPEFIEYLKSQGEEGIKILKGGLKKIEAAYEGFKKVQRQNAINFAQLLPANLLREKQNFKIQNRFEERLEKEGFNEEQSQRLIEGIGGPEGIRDYQKAKNKKKKDRTKKEQNQVFRIDNMIKQGGGIARELDQFQILDEANKSIKEMNKEIDNKNQLLKEGYTQEEADQIMQLGDVSKLSADQIKKLGDSIKKYNLAVLASDPDALSQAVRDNLIDINNIKREIDEINNIVPLEKELKILEKSNENKSRAIELKQRELEPLDEQINKIQELSEKTSEAYDNQIKALDEIYEREDKIASLKQAQLGVAQALSRGDVGAAAQGALQMSQDIAEQSRQEARSALDAQREAAIKNNQNQILAIQQQRKVIEDQIKNLQAEQRIIQDSIYTKQGEINIEADRLDGLYNNAANELKNLNAQLEEAIRLQTLLNVAKAAAEAAAARNAPPAPAPSTASSYATGLSAFQNGPAAGTAAGEAALAAFRATPGEGLDWAPGNIFGFANGGMINEYMYGGGVAYRGSKEPAPGMMNYGGMMKKYAHGSIVPGIGMTDRVPAFLTPGEFVIRKSVAETYGPMLSALNSQVFPKMNLSSSMPSLKSNENQGNVYNYQVSVALNGSDLDPNDVANVVMQKIKMSESRNLRSNNIRG